VHSQLDCIYVVSVYPEKLDDQLAISPSNASQDSVGICMSCIVQVFGYGHLVVFMALVPWPKSRRKRGPCPGERLGFLGKS
jgi:hypothetical protein